MPKFVSATTVTQEPAFQSLLRKVEAAFVVDGRGKRSRKQFRFSAKIRGVNTQYKLLFIELSPAVVEEMFGTQNFNDVNAVLDRNLVEQSSENVTPHFPWFNFVEEGVPGALGLRIRYKDDTFIEGIPPVFVEPVTAVVSVQLTTYAHYPEQGHFGVSAKLSLPVQL